MDITELTLTQMMNLMGQRKLSPVELVDAYLQRIEAYDSTLHSYITVTHKEARDAAIKAEKSIMDTGLSGPLDGLPLAVKDQFETRGILTTAGSRMLSDYIPSNNATVIDRCIDAGAILLGKLNMTAFATGGGDPYQYGNPPRNPWDLERDPGSSSSGSGIAVAASLCAMSLGEDTIGSIRGPASANGIVGLRPTWGRVSRFGMIPACWSMDTGGPMAATVEDVAIMLRVISGYDSRDPQTSRMPTEDYQAALSTDLSGLRIGILTEYMDDCLVDGDIKKAVSLAYKHLETLGANIEEVSLPLLTNLGPECAVISLGDAGYLHRNWLRNRANEYGTNTRRTLLLGNLFTSQMVQKAVRIREVFVRKWSQLFDKFDLLVSPTDLAKTKKLKSSDSIINPTDAVERFKNSIGTAMPASLAGTPAMSVPCGFDSNGMPVGLQIMGRHFQEATVLKAGYSYEQTNTWHLKKATSYKL